MKFGHLFSGRANLFRRLVLAFVCGQFVWLLIAFSMKAYLDVVREEIRYHYGSSVAHNSITQLILAVYLTAPPILIAAIVASLGARRETRCRNCHGVLRGLTVPLCDRCGEPI